MPARGPGLLWNPLALAPDAPEEMPLMDVCDEVAEDIFECSLNTLCMLGRERHGSPGNCKGSEEVTRVGDVVLSFNDECAENKRNVEKKSGVVECRPSFFCCCVVAGVRKERERERERERA